MGQNAKVREKGLGSSNHGFFFAPLPPHSEAPIQPSPVLLGHFPLSLSLLHPGFPLYSKSSFSTTPVTSPGVPRPSQPQVWRWPWALPTKTSTQLFIYFPQQHPPYISHNSHSAPPQYFPKDQSEYDFTISKIHLPREVIALVQPL